MAEERQVEYETVYIMRPSSNAEDDKKARERVEGIIENMGGHVLKFDNWGMRKLAYDIRDKSEQIVYDRGHYLYYRYIAPSQTVAEIERNLKILDPVIKWQTIKIEDDLLPSQRVSLPTDIGEIDVLEVGAIEQEE